MSFAKYKKILWHAAIQSHLHTMDKDKYIEQCWILKYERDDSDSEPCIPFLSNASIFTYCEKCLFLSVNNVFAKQKNTGRTQKKILSYFQISTLPVKVSTLLWMI